MSHKIDPDDLFNLGYIVALSDDTISSASKVFVRKNVGRGLTFSVLSSSESSSSGDYEVDLTMKLFKKALRIWDINVIKVKR